VRERTRLRKDVSKKRKEREREENKKSAEEQEIVGTQRKRASKDRSTRCRESRIRAANERHAYKGDIGGHRCKRILRSFIHKMNLQLRFFSLKSGGRRPCFKLFRPYYMYKEGTEWKMPACILRTRICESCFPFFIFHTVTEVWFRVSNARYTHSFP